MLINCNSSIFRGVVPVSREREEKKNLRPEVLIMSTNTEPSSSIRLHNYLLPLHPWVLIFKKKASTPIHPDSQTKCNSCNDCSHPEETRASRCSKEGKSGSELSPGASASPALFRDAKQRLRNAELCHTPSIKTGTINKSSLKLLKINPA